MPYFRFATYADYREEWAIQAASLEEARKRIGTDPDGPWLNEASRIDADCIECRDEFVTEDDDETPAVEEITPDHWAYRNVHQREIEHSLKQNISALSAEFHTHPRYAEFYDTVGAHIEGFVGQYELCIAMAEALTEWEVAHGLTEAYEQRGICWIDVIADFVDTIIQTSLNQGTPAVPSEILPTIRVLTRAQPEP